MSLRVNFEARGNLLARRRGGYREVHVVRTCSRYNFSFPFLFNEKSLELTVRFTSTFTNGLFQAPMSLRVNLEARENLLARRRGGYREVHVVRTCSRYNFSFPFLFNEKSLELTIRFILFQIHHKQICRNAIG